MTRDVVRGRPAGGATPRRFRTTGDMAEGPSRSSIGTSVSDTLANMTLGTIIDGKVTHHR